MGRFTRSHVRARVVEIETPASFATAMWLALVGSIHMSWLSPPGELSGGPAGCGTAAAAAAAAAAAPPPPNPAPRLVAPPSMLRENVAQRKYVSSGLSDDTAMRV